MQAVHQAMLIPDFYSILHADISADKVEAHIRLQAEHPIFKGHFPGNPVTPGVCMLQIVKELTEQATQQQLRLRHCKNIKFTALINPFTDPELHISLQIKPETAGGFKVTGAASFAATQALKVQALLSA